MLQPEIRSFGKSDASVNFDETENGCVTGAPRAFATLDVLTESAACRSKKAFLAAILVLF